MRIIFFGNTSFSEPARKLLTQAGYDLTIISKEGGSLKDEKFFEYFKSLNPELCIVADYGRIIPPRYLELPKHGFINIHPSLLPKYRGPSPIQTAILNGDTETGVSIIAVDEEVDHGPILTQRELESLISNFEFLKLREELAKLGAELLIETLPKYLSGEIQPKEQDHRQATSTKMFTRADARIDWSRPGEEIYNQIRALNPEPGTWTMWKSKILNVREVVKEVVKMPMLLTWASLQPGTVLKLDGDVAIITKTCYLVLKKIQLEGGKVMDAKSFINGHPDFLNSTLE